MTPEVTVAMSMRNASRYIRECIDSILSQTFTDFELLIVDDGSTDGSVEIVRAYSDPRIRLICRDHDFTASLNTLLDRARGRYIARMDADDIMMPDRLQVEYDYLESHPEVAAVCSQAIRIDALGNMTGHIGSGSATLRITPRMMCEANHVCNPSSMMRSGIVGVGLRYEREYEYAEDYRFWSRVVSEIGPVDCLPRELLHYRVSDTQVTATRWDEMMQATARIKADLIATLVDKANPGYTDPAIGDSHRELTLIIPFLNEGEEVENTVRSFLDHGGRGRVDIIVINDCSYDSYPYMERLSAIPGVSYFLNRERLGVAASRDKGVALCRTPYFLLLDAHMRAYDDLWATEIPRLLRENDRRILCCQTRFLIYDKDRNILKDPKSPPAFGARMTFHVGQPMPGIEWIKEESNPDEQHEVIPAVLGAGYSVSCNYWAKIGGLKGLRQYGCDEQLMSLKTWLEGGECLLLKDIVFGHIYRSNMPYSFNRSSMFFNNLLISETLFPVKECCKARATAYLYDREQFVTTFGEISSEIASNPDLRLCYGDKTQHSFHKIISMNRSTTSLERKLVYEIESRLPEIASFLSDHPKDNPGLYEGSAGYALWLALYGDHCMTDTYTDKAHDYLLTSVNNMDLGDLSFSSGITGIGWALSYLSRIGFTDCHDSVIADIDKAVCDYIITTDINNADYSLSHGLAGLLAYSCMNPSIAENSLVGQRLDLAASAILSHDGISVTDAFYAFLWMQMRRKSTLYSDQISFSLRDWNKPSVFIAKDNRFWDLSLYDGVLATSSICFS